MKVKIVQWNIWCREDIDKVIYELTKINADIACLQELNIIDNDNSKIEKIAQLYPFIYYCAADTFFGKSQCNAIISKYPLMNKKNHFLQFPSDNKADASFEGRIYLEADVKVKEEILKVGTAHLSYTDRFIETNLKDKEVNRLIDIIKKKNSNYIFTGDLNTTSDSNYIRMIRQYLTHYETDNTWTTKPFSYRGFHETGLNWKLDYIFTTPDVHVQNVEVYQTDVSDHLPVIAEIII